MKKGLTLSLLCLCCVASMMAVPAKRVKKTIMLGDGTIREVVLCGDENGHYLQAADGTMFQMKENGEYVTINREKLSSQRKAKPKAAKVKRRATWGLERQDFRGEKKGLVILVNFSDKKMSHTRDEFDDYFNKAGYSINGMGGSVRDYFLTQSYGQLTIDFDVLGPVTVSQKMSYYGGNDDNGDDKAPATMVCEAIKAVDSQVNFADYDWDDDGYVDQVYVIYAGYGEAQGASSNTIWPHEWELSSAAYYGDGDGALTLDGVTIETYACSNELYGSGGSTKMDGVGTACHEFSHCLGIPDFYDTSGSNFGMNCWSIMDYGCYGGDGYVPCGYTSYERMYAGWMNPIELTSYTEVNDMPSISSDSVAYLIRNAKKPSEYYLLENRQKTGWDKYLPADGLLVLHVDFDSDVWINNSVNTTSSRQRMTIIPADANANESSTSGDTWPRSGKTELTDNSTPPASLYNANTDGRKLMNFPICDIKKNTTKKTVSFVAGHYEMATPVATEATDVTNQSFRANWDALDDATSYEVVLTIHDPSADQLKPDTLLVETFEGFTSTNTTNVTSSLNQHTQTTGWSGTYIYTTIDGGVRLGSYSSAGSITTPTLPAPESGEATISITCKEYDTNPLTVTCNGVQIGTIELTSEMETATITFPVTTDFYLTIKANKRAYLGGLVISTANTGTTKTVVTTTDNYFDFSGLELDKEYSYVVYAYHDEAKSEESNSISVLLDADYNAIDAIVVDESAVDGQVYDLSGRRQTGRLTKGIYIVNGKKRVVR